MRWIYCVFIINGSLSITIADPWANGSLTQIVIKSHTKQPSLENSWIQNAEESEYEFYVCNLNS